MAASLWLLEAKAFQEEERSEASYSVQFWLKPGGYTVGRQGADIVVEEDKSISRRHAELSVPPATQGDDPHVLVKGQCSLKTRSERCRRHNAQSCAAFVFRSDAPCVAPALAPLLPAPRCKRACVLSRGPLQTSASMGPLWISQPKAWQRSRTHRWGRAPRHSWHPAPW